mgnify:FL=1
MNNNYLIPANSKKSQLILGFFTPVDLILFGSGCGLTLLLLMLVRNASAVQMIIILLPALVTGFLVTPVLYYHNVLQFIINVVSFIFNTRRYYWRGWCVKYDSEDKQ